MPYKKVHRAIGCLLSWGNPAAGVPCLLMILCAYVATPAVGRADEPTAIDDEQSPGLLVPWSGERVLDEVMTWTASARPDEQTARQMTGLWSDMSSGDESDPDELLDRVVESFGIADAGTRRYLNAQLQDTWPEMPIADGVRQASFYQNHLRLYHARWLAQHRQYDQALVILDDLAPEETLHPAGVLFYRAVCCSKLLQDEGALAAITVLQQNCLRMPSRYAVLAEMMKADILRREEEGLSAVARLMDDVHRRLDLEQPGEPTQQREEQVIAMLDKLLEDLNQESEDQQQGGEGGGGGNQQQQRPGSAQAADQSEVRGSAGEGIADNKDITEEGRWGLLDQRQEARARELIRRQFPPNYLDAIQKYTKRLAEQSQKP